MTDAPARPRAVLACHAGLAAGLASAVEAIAGAAGAFVPVTNADLGADGVAAALRDALDAHGLDVVFTDLPAGSLTIAARRLQRERPGLTVVAGANLAALLDFALHDEVPAAAAALAAADRGRAALVAWAPA